MSIYVNFSTLKIEYWWVEWYNFYKKYNTGGNIEMYNYLPEKVRKAIKKPFVFVSYCHGNKEVYSKVKLLVLYLRNKGINVVYDEGGLRPGVELTQFENLILHDNCRYVLVVCDKFYNNRIKENQGGSWREYFNISNDYPKNRLKYIPLIFDDYLSIFSGKVYINFSHDSENAFSEIEKVLESVKKKVIGNKNKVDELAKEADILCDNYNYRAADKKITEAIMMYTEQPRAKRSILAELYNLKVYICIVEKNASEAVKNADKVWELIKSNNHVENIKKALFYNNCALAYRMIDKSSNKYDECAKLAYELAKKTRTNELDYYACMYATALYETEQYTKSYEIIKIALEEFERNNSNVLTYTEDDYIMYVKIKGNIAEIAAACSKNSNLNRKKKLEFLMEAQKHVLDILKIEVFEDSEKMKKEIYSISCRVFKELEEFYSV